MKWALIIIGSVMAVIGGVNLGKATISGKSEASAPVFVYDEASPEEQEAWLTSQSETLEYGVQRALGTDRPTLSHLSYKEAKVSTGKREVKYVATLSKWIEGPLPHDFRKKLQDRLCPKYVKTDLYENNVSVAIRVERKNGRRAFAGQFGTNNCKRYVQLAEK